MHSKVSTLCRMSLSRVRSPRVFPVLLAEHLNPTGVAAVVIDGVEGFIACAWVIPQRGVVLQLVPRDLWLLLHEVLPLPCLAALTPAGANEAHWSVSDASFLDGSSVSIKAGIHWSGGGSLVCLVLGGAVFLSCIEALLLTGKVAPPTLVRLAASVTSQAQLPVNSGRAS